MPRRQSFKIRSDLLNPGLDISLLLNRVLGEARNNNHVLLPSAQDQLKKYLIQAKNQGNINSERDVIVGATALIVAGARETTKHRIFVRDINKGWVNLRRCPGNLPPPKCMRRSIIDVELDLRKKLPEFSNMVDAIIKEQKQ